MRRFSKHYLQVVASGVASSLVLIFSPIAKSQSQIVPVEDAAGHRVFVNANMSGSQAEEFSAPGSPSTGAASRPSGSQPHAIRQAVQQEAGRAKVDPKLVRAIIKVESDGNPKAVSPKGAQGLMQLIPATARRFGVDNPFDPNQNIRGGVTYLRYLLDLFKGNVPLMLAAYDAGEHRVMRTGGIPPIPETQNYVRKVTALYQASGGSNGLESSPGLPRTVAIYRFVDSSGVVHFATGDDDLPQNVQLAESGQPD
ncbi:MAG TPA: lytic transglycosylase domain-containing protein [Terriglobia bacterium]|nr:lytic transglycosylase domain-containing protein [Terriglobia bacterium]